MCDSMCIVCVYSVCDVWVCIVCVYNAWQLVYHVYVVCDSVWTVCVYSTDIILAFRRVAVWKKSDLM